MRWLDLEMRKQSMSSVLQKAIRHDLSGFLLFSEVELTGYHLTSSKTDFLLTKPHKYCKFSFSFSAKVIEKQ